MAARSDFAGRYPASRIAAALSLQEASVEVALGGAEPPGWDADDAAEAALAAAALDTAVADANDQAASAVGQRYDWAQASGAPALVRIAVDLAMFDLYDNDVPDDIILRMRNARSDLRKLADGSRALLGADGALVPERDRVLVDAGEATFNADALDGFLHPSRDSGPHRTGPRRTGRR